MSMRACRGDGRQVEGDAARCGSPCRAAAASGPGGAVRADFERALADLADRAPIVLLSSGSGNLTGCQ